MSKIREYLKSQAASLPRHRVPPQDWFRDGEDALMDAQMALEEGSDPAKAMALSQQAVRMYLTGFLVLNGIKLDAVREIEYLLNVGTEFEPTLVRYRGGLKRLVEMEEDGEARIAVGIASGFVVSLRRMASKQVRNMRMPR